MKKIYFIIIVLLALFGCHEKESIIDHEVKTDLLKIYINESLGDGLGPIIAAEFEKKYECSVIMEVIENETLLLQKLILEKENPQADIVIGIQSTSITNALATNLFVVYEPENIKNITDKSLLLDKRFRLIPYKYAYYAFLYDTTFIHTPPKTFGEMQSSIWRDKFILIDPQSSATGYGLLLWTLGVWGERGFEAFWDSISSNVLSIQPSLYEAYMSFQTGEAPFVLSYSTIPAYYIEIENSTQYQAYIPEEGGLKEIGFAGILQGSKNIYLARRFMEFMLTKDFQKHIPTTQWMLPVIDGIDLPEGFSSAPKPKIDLTEKIFSKSDNFADRWIDLWIKTVTVK